MFIFPGKVWAALLAAWVAILGSAKLIFSGKLDKYIFRKKK